MRWSSINQTTLLDVASGRSLTGSCTDEVEVPELDRRCNDLPARARLASLGNAGRIRTI